ncbi:putative ATP-dependent RNA helicase DDX5 [Nibea albiflora]|nr:putative ATP-dependent RNA helicase DDX5 [Nibea albiflora]
MVEKGPTASEHVQASFLTPLSIRHDRGTCFLQKGLLAARRTSAEDSENEKKDLPFQHQEEISDKLGNAEGLLKDLSWTSTKPRSSNIHRPERSRSE